MLLRRRLVMLLMTGVVALGGDHSLLTLASAIFNNVARVIAEALGHRKFIDQRLGLDGAQADVERPVEELIAANIKDDIRDGVNISRGEVANQLASARVDHLAGYLMTSLFDH